MHSPHSLQGDSAKSEYFRLTRSKAILNINKNISCLAAGPLSPAHKRDVLVVGCSTSLQVYDLVENKDLFYKEIPDGVCSLLFATLGSINAPVILVGENCSIQVRALSPVGL